jgi:tagatose-1,6-bisphosphate aldolase non-catalytic subunit AgaZ/GatZ
MTAPDRIWRCEPCRNVNIVHCAHPEECGSMLQYVHNDLYTAALARAEKAEAERDALIVGRDMLGRWWEKEKARADRAEALLKEAVEALRPFSQMAIRNGTTVVCDVSADHVAAARATLAKIKEAKDNG